MKLWKKALALALVFCVSLSLCACSTVISTFGEILTDPAALDYWADPNLYVAFQSDEGKTYITVTDMMAYETQYPDCNGTWFRDRLTGEDRLIYNSYLYAMENCYTAFTVYVADNGRDLFAARDALSLDSPFLEQNYNESETVWTYSPDLVGQRVDFCAEQFTKARWALKMAALEECRRIVAEIPAECQTQEQKMVYLYEYVVDHIEYIDYPDLDDQDYLYDAVMKGQTNCDGYSNMLLLLWRLIGVSCCEAMGDDILDDDNATDEQLENGGGHTWVVAQLEEQLYNFDPTFEDTDDLTGRNRYFAFSDGLVGVQYMDCEDLRPKCTDTSRDLGFADMTVTDFRDTKQIKAAAKLWDDYAKQERFDIVILIRGAMTEEEADDFMQKCIDRSGRVSEISYYWDDAGDYSIFDITVKDCL